MMNLATGNFTASPLECKPVGEDVTGGNQQHWPITTNPGEAVLGLTLSSWLRAGELIFALRQALLTLAALELQKRDDCGQHFHIAAQQFLLQEHAHLAEAYACLAISLSGQEVVEHRTTDQTSITKVRVLVHRVARRAGNM